MADFINTIDALGEDAVIDSIIDRSITEFKDDTLETVGKYAFYGCNSLETVDLPNVKTVGNYAFSGSSLNNPSKLATVNLPNAEYIGDSAFRNNRTVTSIDLPRVTSMGKEVFANCSELTSINLPNLTSTDARAFWADYGPVVKYISLPLLLEVKTLFAGRFTVEIRLDSATTINTRAFHGCTALKKVVLPSVKKIKSQAFSAGAAPLTALILSGSEVCTLENVDALTNTSIASDSTGYIYVPKALIEDYKVATNWSTYATQFRALEDYTVDGTVTGELDETKI